MKTPMEKLFMEFETLSVNMRFAGDITSAGLIDYLCERKEVALLAEKEYLEKNK